MNEIVLLVVIIIGIVANIFSLFVSAKMLIWFEKLIDLQAEHIKNVVDISLTALSEAFSRTKDTQEDKAK